MLRQTDRRLKVISRGLQRSHIRSVNSYSVIRIVEDDRAVRDALCKECAAFKRSCEFQASYLLVYILEEAGSP
jgi:hypothetical protein